MHALSKNVILRVPWWTICVSLEKQVLHMPLRNSFPGSRISSIYLFAHSTNTICYTVMLSLSSSHNAIFYLLYKLGSGWRSWSFLIQAFYTDAMAGMKRQLLGLKRCSSYLTFSVGRRDEMASLCTACWLASSNKIAQRISWFFCQNQLGVNPCFN